MSLFPAALVLLVVLVSGHGWLRFLRYRPDGGPAWLGFALAAGVSWWGILATLASAADLFLWPLLVPLALLPHVGIRLGLGPRDEGSVTPEPGGGRLEWLVFVPVFVVFALSLGLALERPVWNIDSLRRWALHAQWLATEHTALPPEVRDPAWASTHPSYPPLVPALMALALEWGADRDYGLRPLFPAFLLGLAGLVFGFARRRSGPALALALSLAVVLTPAFLTLDSHERAIGLGADAALADLPLAFLLTALSILVLEGLGRGGRGAWRLAALVAAGCTLTKNEGMAFAPAMLLATLVVFWVKGRRPEAWRIAWPLGGALGALLLWKLLTRDVTVMPGEAYLDPSILATLGQAAERFPKVMGRVGAELVAFEPWGILWLVPLVSLGLLFGRERREGARLELGLLWLWLGCGLALVVLAYLVTGWREGRYAFLMEVSLARLLMHHAPLAALFAALACEATGRSKEAGSESDAEAEATLEDAG